MADPPDLASLAKRYVDLWQDQLIAMAADPALAEGTSRLLAALVPAVWPPGKADDESQFRSRQSPPSGPAPAGAASDERDERLAELARCLTAIEKRLAALEAGIRGAGRGAKPRPARRGGKKPGRRK